MRRRRREAHAIDRVRSTVGESIDGFPVDVRPASAEDLAESALAPNLLQLEASGGGIGYDDNNRTTEKFSLEPMQGQMEVICHVGPERSWPELQDFIAGARRTLVTAMYEFNAKHIADAVQRSMDEGVKFDATLDGMLAEKNETDRELFNEKPTFRRWEIRFGNRFSSSMSRRRRRADLERLSHQGDRAGQCFVLAVERQLEAVEPTKRVPRAQRRHGASSGQS